MAHIGGHAPAEVGERLGSVPRGGWLLRVLLAVRGAHSPRGSGTGHFAGSRHRVVRQWSLLSGQHRAAVARPRDSASVVRDRVRSSVSFHRPQHRMAPPFAHHLAGRVDAQGAAANRYAPNDPKVGHGAILPEKGMFRAPAYATPAYDLA